jgi:hypothetical protein
MRPLVRVSPFSWTVIVAVRGRGEMSQSGFEAGREDARNPEKKRGIETTIPMAFLVLTMIWLQT